MAGAFEKKMQEAVESRSIPGAVLVAGDREDPVLIRYQKWQGKSPEMNTKLDMKQAFTHPLLFAPGESWEYGVGIDWAGWMVERVNGNVTLEDYIHRNIWVPLGVTSFSFFPKTNPAVFRKMTDMSQREGGLNQFGTTAEPDGKVLHTDDMIWNMEPRGYSGGAGGYGAPLDYQKMLHSILADGGKLLRKETVDEMFKPQLASASKQQLMELMKIPEVNNIFGGHPLGTEVNFGLGGLLLMEDMVGRKRGTMTWDGYPNLIWFVDRLGGMSGIYESQINPPGDPKTIELLTAWSEVIYQKFGKLKL